MCTKKLDRWDRCGWLAALDLLLDKAITVEASRTRPLLEKSTYERRARFSDGEASARMILVAKLN
jgi:hypothetical protein